MRMLTFNLLWSSAFAILLLGFLGCQSTQVPQLCDALYIKSQDFDDESYLVRDKCDVKVKTSETCVILGFPKFETITIQSDNYEIQRSFLKCKIRHLNEIIEIPLTPSIIRIKDPYTITKIGDGVDFSLLNLHITNSSIKIYVHEWDPIYTIKRSGNEMEQFKVVTDKEIPMTVAPRRYDWW